MNLPAWFRDVPIKRKLLSIGLLIPAVALLFTSLILTAKDIVEWRIRTISELTTYAKVIGSNVAPAMLFDDRKAAADILAALSAKPDIVHAVIYDQKGKVFAAYTKQPSHPVDHLLAVEMGNYLLTFDELAIANPIHFKNDTPGSIYLESDLQGLYAGILRSAGLIFLTAFGVFLLAAFLFAKLQKIIVAPILDMSGAMQNVIAEQDFAVRVAVHGKDEVGKLAGTFNIMLEYIQQRDTELAEHRGRLEDEVAQRTAELRETNWLLKEELTERTRAEQALKEALSRLQQVASRVPGVVYQFRLHPDGSACVPYASEAIREIYRINPEEVREDASKAFIHVHPDDLANHMASIQVSARDLTPWQQEYRLKFDDGTVRWLFGNALPQREADGAVLWNGFITDVTERKQAEQELRIAATAFETQEGIMITDRDSRILRVNRAFTRLTGYSAGEAVGNTPAMLQSGRQDAEFYRNMWERLIRDKCWHGELWNRRKNGEIYPESITITAVTDANGQVTHYVSVFSDITQRKQNEEEIFNLAFYDPLTQLPNRRLLMDRLSHALASGTRSIEYAAIMFIDLDNFKILNDTQGHDVGDLLLVETARRLQDCVREGDTVARLGGDEFVVILEGLSAEVEQAATQSEVVGQKIRAALSQPYLLKDFQHHSSSSIGIGLFHGRDVTVDELLKRADMAMYEAKTSGRNALRFFDPAMQTNLETRSTLEIDLRRAVSRQEEFLLYYQPQVDSSGRLIGAEALLRWRHPERGMVSPAEFIPLAEESGLILPLGHWVLTTACQQLVAWAAQPATAHLTVAVNVSAKQFHLPTFVDEVLTLVDYFEVNTARLKLEITESLLLDNVDDIIAKMTMLKARGISFSMDDFGTGYSSLSYLKRLPLCQLKIDQSFVRDILTDPNDAAIAKIIVSLAQSMNLAVIAEGVETEAQRDFLEQNGCHVFQGYLFSRPIQANEFEQLVAQCA